MIDSTIKAFVISLRHRTDRRRHIEKEFKGRPEFDVTIIDTVANVIGARGLWQTIKHVLQTHAIPEEYVLICEDDHQFTNNYNKELFFKAIQRSLENEVDVLSGGVSWLNCAVQISEHVYWTEKFSGLQFTVIFKKAYSKILNANFNETDVADYKICSLTENKYFVHPFISIQKEFGYSDVTFKNNVLGRVDELFRICDANVSILKNIARFYPKGKAQRAPEEIITTDICINTYIVKSGGRNTDEYIRTNFFNRPELTPFVLEGDVQEQNRLFSAAVLKDIIEKAIASNEDVIIVCDEFHRFAPSYSAQYLISNILEAYEQGTDILFGGGNDFGPVVPISANSFWIGSVIEPHFFVVFKNGFSKLLERLDDFSDDGEVDILSSFSSNKMILCPFVSDSNAGAESRLLKIGQKYEQLTRYAHT